MGVFIESALGNNFTYTPLKFERAISTENNNYCVRNEIKNNFTSVGDFLIKHKSAINHNLGTDCR